MIKLIATDLDGTLLDEDGSIPTNFLPTLKEISKKNVKFVIASGRPYYTLKEDFYSVSKDLIFIADNGSTIIENNKIIYCNIIEKSLVKKVISQYKKSSNSYIVLCCRDCAYIESNDERFINEVNKYYYKKEVVDNIEDIKDDVIKISICCFNNVKNLAEKYFLPTFENDLQIVISGEIWLDIMDNNINKGNSLQKIQDKYAITKGETIAFGDYYNDIPMFDRAYYSYAMANSPEDIKRKARKSAPSNKENGVTSILRDTFNL